MASCNRWMVAKRRLANKRDTCADSTGSTPSLTIHLESRVHSLLRKASTKAGTLHRQQIDELRALARPPLIIRKILGLVFVVLHPAAASEISTPEDISWRDRIMPMLRSEEFLKELASYPCSGQMHPLLLWPLAEAFLRRNITMEGFHACEYQETTASTSLLRRGSNPSSQTTAKTLLPRASATIRLGSSLAGQTLRHSKSSPVMVKPPEALPTPLPLAASRQLTLETANFASKTIASFFRWVVTQLDCVQALRDLDAASKQASAQQMDEVLVDDCPGSSDTPRIDLEPEKVEDEVLLDNTTGPNHETAEEHVSVPSEETSSVSLVSAKPTRDIGLSSAPDPVAEVEPLTASQDMPVAKISRSVSLPVSRKRLSNTEITCMCRPPWMVAMMGKCNCTIPSQIRPSNNSFHNTRAPQERLLVRYEVA